MIAFLLVPYPDGRRWVWGQLEVQVPPEMLTCPIQPRRERKVSSLPGPTWGGILEPVSLFFKCVKKGDVTGVPYLYELQLPIANGYEFLFATNPMRAWATPSESTSGKS